MKRDSQKPFEVHLTDEELRQAEDGYAIFNYYRTGRGQYNGNSVNTTCDSISVSAADSTPENLQLPSVRLGIKECEIDYAGKTYVIQHYEAAEALKAIIQAFPQPVALNKALDNPHPKRLIDKLPETIRQHIVLMQPNKGYRWKL